jgi:U1 small nuclear ribonucleoprotein C
MQVCTKTKTILFLKIMPKYYCDYCDVYLTHDSPSVRKLHNSGWKHKTNVKAYYSQFLQEETPQTTTISDQKQKPFNPNVVQGLPFNMTATGVQPTLPPPYGGVPLPFAPGTVPSAATAQQQPIRAPGTQSFQPMTAPGGTQQYTTPSSMSGKVQPPGIPVTYSTGFSAPGMQDTTRK